MLVFKTPEDKYQVFQKSELIMFSGNNEVEKWGNTQPLYFYPFSWLDYLNKEGIRELIIQDCSFDFAKKEILSLNNSKVHFEGINLPLMALAKEKGHKVSVICDLEDLIKTQANNLLNVDFLRIRVGRDLSHLDTLSNLPNLNTLSGIKVYLGESCDYLKLANKTKEIGFDFIHVSKRLLYCTENSFTSEEEKENLRELKTFETSTFKIILPPSLEKVFAEKFVISSNMGNTSNCSFLKYRLILNKDKFYPCLTKSVLSQEGVKRKDLISKFENCSDCACIYENDMLQNIKDKMKTYKNPYFALNYIQNGR